MGELVLPEPPEGFQYKLVPIKHKKPDKPKKKTLKDKNPEELSKRQLWDLEYREKNREKISEKRRLRYQKQKEANLSKEETSETTKSE
jgi:hypothetical protein